MGRPFLFIVIANIRGALPARARPSAKSVSIRLMILTRNYAQRARELVYMSELAADQAADNRAALMIYIAPLGCSYSVYM